MLFLVGTDFLSRFLSARAGITILAVCGAEMSEDGESVVSRIN